MAFQWSVVVLDTLWMGIQKKTNIPLQIDRIVYKNSLLFEYKFTHDV